MLSATLTSKGQLTVPKEIRDRLRLEQGDVLDFELLPGGTLRISPRRPRPTFVGRLRGYARPSPVPVEEMDTAIGRHHAAENARARRGR